MCTVYKNVIIFTDFMWLICLRKIKEILHPYNQHFLKSVLDFFMKFLSRPDKMCLQRSNAVVVSVTQSLLGLRGGIYRFLDQEI